MIMPATAWQTRLRRRACCRTCGPVCSPPGSWAACSTASGVQRGTKTSFLVSLPAPRRAWCSPCRQRWAAPQNQHLACPQVAGNVALGRSSSLASALPPVWEPGLRASMLGSQLMTSLTSQTVGSRQCCDRSRSTRVVHRRLARCSKRVRRGCIVGLNVTVNVPARDHGFDFAVNICPLRHGVALVLRNCCLLLAGQYGSMASTSRPYRTRTAVAVRGAVARA